MTTDDGTVHFYGLRFLEDVWRYYVLKVITARQAILLAHVDYFCNPQQQKKDGEWDAVKSKFFRTDTLETILQCSRWTVWHAVCDLQRLRGMFKARKMARDFWELKTKPRQREQAFYVYPIIRKLFEAGAYTPIEMLIMADIASFTLNGQFYWKSNRQIGDRLGLRSRGVEWHLAGLRARGELIAETMTHDEACEVLERIGYEKMFRRKGGRITRFLSPTREELWEHNQPRFLIEGSDFDCWISQGGRPVTVGFPRGVGR